MNAGQSVVPAAKAVDHLLLGTADLDRGIAWVEKLTGVRAAIWQTLELFHLVKRTRGRAVGSVE